MPQRPRGERPRDRSKDIIKYGTAALVVATMLGLTVYMTIRTGEIPYQIAVPLLGAALWALYNFQISGPRGED